MKEDLVINNMITIPLSELEIKASRSSGAGGQHVNKTDSRITVRWNVQASDVLTEEQKLLVCKKLASRLTNDGDLVIHDESSRSQLQNKKAALQRLIQIVRKALIKPKKRMKTRIPKAAKEKHLTSKNRRGELKKMRSKKYLND